MSGPGGYQQFGPDPDASQSYASDPYYQEQYGQPDPYAQQPDPYAQQQYAQYPQTGGFYGPPQEPKQPKRSKLPMILSLIAIVIIVGAVVTIVLLNRNKNQEAAGTGDDKPSSQEKEPSGRGNKDDEDDKGDWLTIDNKAEASLSYQVPPDWKQADVEKDSGFEGLPFTGTAEYGVYDCEGKKYIRSFATSGSVTAAAGSEIKLEDTVKDFVNSFAHTYHGPEAKIDLADPEESKVDGKQAITLTAKVTPQVDKPNCQASEASVTMIGVLLETDGKPTAVSMLVVVNDTKGGPEDPKPAPASAGRDILATVRAG